MEGGSPEGRHQEMLEAGTAGEDGAGVSETSPTGKHVSLSGPASAAAPADAHYAAAPPLQASAMAGTGGYPPAQPMQPRPGGMGGPAAGASMPTAGGQMQPEGQQIAQEVASQVLQGAGRIVRRSAAEIRVYVQANPKSITTASFLGGCWLAFASLLTLLNVFNALSPLSWLLQLYQLFFGLLIVAIDGPSDRLPRELKNRMIGFTALLQSRINRVLFYLFVGCQQASQNGWVNALTGWYFAFVAVGFAAVQCVGPPGPPGGDVPLNPGAASH